MLDSNTKNRLRIVIKGFDTGVVDQVTRHLSSVLKKSELEFAGPIPLPRKDKYFTVLKSPNGDKDARQTFRLADIKRIIELPESKNAVATLGGIKSIHPCVRIKIKSIAPNRKPVGGKI